jgi:hypothetical protein
MERELIDSNLALEVDESTIVRDYTQTKKAASVKFV